MYLQTSKSKMGITALTKIKAEVFRNISALSSVKSQIEEFLLSDDKMLPNSKDVK